MSVREVVECNRTNIADNEASPLTGSQLMTCNCSLEQGILGDVL